MNRIAILLAAVTLAVTVPPLAAQKSRPASPASGPDADRDGVADAADRCPNTPPSQRVGRDGCPIALVRPGAAGAAQPAPAGTGQPAPTTRADSGAGAPKSRRPSPVLLGTPGASQTAPAGRAGLVASQAAQPAAAPRGAAGVASAGFSLEPPAEELEDSALFEYARDAARLLDSAIVTLVGVFRNTSGAPVAGATAPVALSQRERERWSRCRDVHWDLQSYSPAVQPLVEAFEQHAALARAAAALDSALRAQRVTEECDNVASMIAAPERWAPWQEQYEAAARRFYRGWYGPLRDVHEKNRLFVGQLNAVLPAGQRVPVPAGLPRTAPYAGAAPR